MKYQKPEVLMLASAMVAVQGGPSKVDEIADSNNTLPTAAAYEADE